MPDPCFGWNGLGDSGFQLKKSQNRFFGFFTFPTQPFGHHVGSSDDGGTPEPCHLEGGLIRTS
jgi:hypothetical protein